VDRVRESTPEAPRDAEMDDVLSETRLRDLFFDETPNEGKRVVLAVCTGWIGSEMMCLWRMQRMLVGCR
jgi:hypothetical protein